METKDLKVEVPLNSKALGDKLTHLSVEVKHDNGGLSLGTGELHSKGIIVSITPIGIEEKEYNGQKYKMYAQILDGKKEHSGFYVFVMACERKSPKKMQMVADKVLPLAETFRDLFLEGKYTEIASMIQSV